MASCKLLTVLVLICYAGGLLGADVRSFIIGGQDAPKGRWPWMVHLNITSNGIQKWRCGGTILSDEWVLTAANCWDKRREPDQSRSAVWVGAHNLQHGAVRYRGIIRVISHHQYKALSTGFVNDIALVQLDKKLKFSQHVASVNLPSINAIFSPSSECWITGWGSIRDGVPLPDPETLQQLRISIIPKSECAAKYPSLPSDMMCAGDMAGGKDACEGDYGGPLVCRAGSGFVQAGIMSYGSPSGCGLPDNPGVYTEVSKYLSFINGYIHRGEEASAEA
ncbi:tryptase-2-like [Pempheris klunzingeri]|uniref:tryptase-2-like n=1 Tax=Pempheris klunzingeri TaxID=3127111 RepID=UPI0039801BFD